MNKEKRESLRNKLRNVRDLSRGDYDQPDDYNYMLKGLFEVLDEMLRDEDEE